MNNKPGVNSKLVLLGIGLLGAALVGISQLQHVTWQGVMGVIGGVLIGIPVMLQKLGQIHIDNIPEPLAAVIRESLKPPPLPPEAE